MFNIKITLLLIIILCNYLHKIYSSPYVRIMEIRPWFNLIDTNNDMHLDYDEIYNALEEHHNKHLKRIAIYHKYVFLDNFVEKLDLENFLKLRQNRKYHKSTPEHATLEKEVFKKTDLNNDGVIDHDEYTHLLSGLGDEEIREKIAHLEFSKADKNGDDKLTYHEVIEHFSPKSDFHEEILATIFEEFDINADNYLDKKELESFHNEILDNHLKHDLKQFMHKVDDNDDDKISLEEAMKHSSDINHLWNRSPDDEQIFEFRRNMNEL